MDLKELYQISKTALEQLPDTDLLDFRLEQVQYNESGKFWDVIISYLTENKNLPVNTSPLAALGGNYLRYERLYKVLHINNDKKIDALLVFNKAS